MKYRECMESVRGSKLLKCNLMYGGCRRWQTVKCSECMEGASGGKQREMRKCMES